MREVTFMAADSKAASNFLDKEYDITRIRKVIFDRKDVKEQGMKFYFYDKKYSLLVKVFGAYNIDCDEGRKELLKLLENAGFNGSYVETVLNSKKIDGFVFNK